MDRFESLHEEIYGYSERALEKQLLRQSRFVPALQTEDWIPEQERVLCEKSQRSISQNVEFTRVRRVLPPSPPTSDETYDSDVEDWRNEDSVTVIQDRGCEFNQSMNEKVYQKTRQKMEEKQYLEDQLHRGKRRYFTARGLFSRRGGSGWDSRIWENFVRIEDEYFEVIDEIHNVEREIANLEAMLASFRDYECMPSTSYSCRENGGTIILSSSGAVDNWRVQNGYLRLDEVNQADNTILF
ncbi:hypothetical protein F4677DRAFT_283144 [Hypoxylon crocopeplum]|nr:hypothetical protein F4677DRAFT_283144 [Hypoxylon crocopeplum]